MDAYLCSPVLDDSLHLYWRFEEGIRGRRECPDHGLGTKTVKGQII